MKKSILFVLVSLFSVSVYSQVFNGNISAEDLEKLYGGEIILRNIKQKENICVESFKNSEAQTVMNDIYELDPNYLVEVLIAKPIKDDNADLIEKFSNLMMDVPKFATIKYVSWPKYKTDPTKTVIDDAEILTSVKNGEYTNMNTALRLKPLNRVTFDMNYYLSKDKDVFYYQAKNNEPATFKNIIKCVNEDKGRLLVIAFKKDNYWIFYGVGGAKTLSIPFLRAKIDKEIMLRAKDFVQYYYDQL